MAVSINQIGYKKLSRVIFEWQASDRASLLALFIVLEIALQWMWFLLVWWRHDTYSTYVNVKLLYPLWLGVTVAGLFFWWMIAHLSKFKDDYAALYRWQSILIAVYSIYIVVFILVMGRSSLLFGVTLMGGTMLGMLLVRRRYVWKAFLAHLSVILVISLIPYIDVNLPTLRLMAIDPFPFSETHDDITGQVLQTSAKSVTVSIIKDGALDWDNIGHLLHSSTLFWHLTYIYLSLPKAFFIVYMFRTLLLILDDSKAEIVTQANQDEMTQLKNRRHGLAQMKQALMTLKPPQDFSIVLLDLDWFKNINDSYGHEIGDQVLREVAHILTQSLTEEAIVSRYGGEEFLMVLPDVGHHAAKEMAEQVRQAIAQHVIHAYDGVSFQVTASLGLYTLVYDEFLCLSKHMDNHAAYDDPAHPHADQSTRSLYFRPQKNQPENAEQLLASGQQVPKDICQYLISTADKALYEAKDQGRNCTVSANDLLTVGKIRLMQWP